jgi:hypothetical protein
MTVIVECLARCGSKNHPIFMRNSKNTKEAQCLIITHLNMLQAKADAIRAAQLETQRELEALMPAVFLRSGVSRGIVKPHHSRRLHGTCGQPLSGCAGER